MYQLHGTRLCMSSYPFNVNIFSLFWINSYNRGFVLKQLLNSTELNSTSETKPCYMPSGATVEPRLGTAVERRLKRL